MQLTPELIDVVKKEVDLKSMYDQCEEVTAQHILHQQFLEKTRWKGMPKIIFYILLQDAFGQPYRKDEKGDLGFAIQLRVQ